jgi:hypothetical protein
MFSKPKYVKDARSYVVTERTGDHSAKKNKQKQFWFDSLSEAEEFIHKQVIEQSK